MTNEEMKKPTKVVKEHYDWNEAVIFIETKYGICIRDYAGLFREADNGVSGYNRALAEAKQQLGVTSADLANCETMETVLALARKLQVPYQDFWHSICDGLDNGSYLEVPREWGSEDYFEEEWERKIAQLFVDEFVEGDSVTFYVCW